MLTNLAYFFESYWYYSRHKYNWCPFDKMQSKLWEEASDVYGKINVKDLAKYVIDGKRCSQIKPHFY